MKSVFLVAIGLLSTLGLVFSAEPTSRELAEACQSLTDQPGIEQFAQALTLAASLPPEWDFKKADNKRALECLVISLAIYLERDVFKLSPKSYSDWLKKAPKAQSRFFHEAKAPLMLDTRVPIRLSVESIAPALSRFSRQGGKECARVLNAEFLANNILIHIAVPNDLDKFESAYKGHFSSVEQSIVDMRIYMLKELMPGLSAPPVVESGHSVFSLKPGERENFISGLIESAMKGELSAKQQQDFHIFRSLHGLQDYAVGIDQQALQSAVQNVAIPFESRSTCMLMLLEKPATTNLSLAVQSLLLAGGRMVCTDLDFHGELEGLSTVSPAFLFYQNRLPDCCINYTALGYIFAHENVLPPAEMLLKQALKRVSPIDLVYLLTHSVGGAKSGEIQSRVQTRRFQQESRLVAKPHQLGWSSVEMLSSGMNNIEFVSDVAVSSSSDPVLNGLYRLDVGEIPRLAREILSAKDLSPESFNLALSNRLFRSAILSHILHAPGKSYIPAKSRNTFDAWLIAIVKELHRTDSPRALTVLRKSKGELDSRIIMSFATKYLAKFRGQELDIHLFHLLRNSRFQAETDPFATVPVDPELRGILSAAFQASLGNELLTEVPAPEQLLEVFQSPQSTLYSILLEGVVLPEAYAETLRDPLLVNWAIRVGFKPKQFSKDDFLNRTGNDRCQEDWIALDQLYSYLKLVRASRLVEAKIE